jgi:hypothetical protein
MGNLARICATLATAIFLIAMLVGNAARAGSVRVGGPQQRRQGQPSVEVANLRRSGSEVVLKAIRFVAVLSTLVLLARLLASEIGGFVPPAAYS